MLSGHISSLHVPVDFWFGEHIAVVEFHEAPQRTRAHSRRTSGIRRFRTVITCIYLSISQATKSRDQLQNRLVSYHIKSAPNHAIKKNDVPSPNHVPASAREIRPDYCENNAHQQCLAEGFLKYNSYISTFVSTSNYSSPQSRSHPAHWANPHPSPPQTPYKSSSTAAAPAY